MNNAFLYKLRYVTIISLKINLKVGEYMTIETNDNLNQLIKAYNHDIELNRLKDILENQNQFICLRQLRFQNKNY